MATLLLRLKAPMQSWGISAKFDRRSTERAPSKSAVIGLIAAALGRKRNEPIDDLNALKFGVRIDAEGTLLRDYQTAKSKKSAYVTHRFYLADAAFLAGVEGDDALLQKIDAALHAPVFPLFLGRRSCPPEGRISLGIRSTSLRDALQNEPWLSERKGNFTQIVMDADENETESYIQRDTPISFDQTHRKFAFRRIVEMTQNLTHLNTSNSEPETSHDPFEDLEDTED